MSLREIRDRARNQLHDAFSLDALCYQAGPAGGSQPVRCRRHTKIALTGAIEGQGAGLAGAVEFKDIEPKLVFRTSEHVPRRGYVYSLGDGNVYMVDHVEVPDGITLTAVCTRLSLTQAASYPGPTDV